MASNYLTGTTTVTGGVPVSAVGQLKQVNPDFSGFDNNISNPGNAFEIVRDKVGSFAKDLPTKLSSVNASSAKGVSSSSSAPAPVDYLNADLAKHYGLNKESAYAEAMANTAYQRAVSDMKAAGLNPALLFSSGAGPASAGRVSSSASGGGRVGSAKRQGDPLYGLLTNGGSLLGAGIGGALGGAPGAAQGTQIGDMIGKTLASAIGLFKGK